VYIRRLVYNQSAAALFSFGVIVIVFFPMRWLFVRLELVFGAGWAQGLPLAAGQSVSLFSSIPQWRKRCDGTTIGWEDEESMRLCRCAAGDSMCGQVGDGDVVRCVCGGVVSRVRLKESERGGR